MKKEIRYEDFIFLGGNALSENLRVDFMDYFKYLLDSDFVAVEDSLKDRMEMKNFPKRSDQQIIEGIVAVTLKDLEKKRKDKNYYICNALCLLQVIRRIFSIDLYNRLNGKDVPQIILHNYEHILKWILLDSQELCNLYCNIIKNDYKYPSNIDSRYVHYVSVHQVLRQSLFGQFSLNSFADMEISAAIAVIRQLIEFRMRRAFGTLSYIDAQGNLLPLELSLVFECLKKHKDDIYLPISLENVERIYKWSNLYIHSGKQDFSWMPYFVEQVLKPLTFGERESCGWDVKNGIKASRKVIDQIYQELITLSKKPDVKIYACKPECILKD
ncbi:hypothetical protein D7V83_18790 [bacterium 0.1xD8-71]|nr:hypothetical protein D7V83_18790 [bacterium 0.1xD8-71]